MSLVRQERPDEQDLNSLRDGIKGLEAQVTGKKAEIARTRTELDAFRVRYHQAVGMLHEELEALEQAITDIEVAELKRQGLLRDTDPEAEGTERRNETTARYTSDSVRKLFRDVAKAIHPDLAQDDHTRDRRHALMIEANRAYALGDEEQLRLILEAWERSPEAVPGNDPDAMRQRLIRRIDQLEDELAMLSGDLAELEASPLARLKTMVHDATARGRDLIRDTVTRLKRDIMIARNRLDAMQDHG